jgi:hypothetical protein
MNQPKTNPSSLSANESILLIGLSYVTGWVEAELLKPLIRTSSDRRLGKYLRRLNRKGLVTFYEEKVKLTPLGRKGTDIINSSGN